jgi:class 3 adenylate cyclase
MTAGRASLVGAKPSDPELAHWAGLIEELRWAGFLLDRDYRLVWASSEIERFLGCPSEEDLGFGLHVLEAFTREDWRRIATPESRASFLEDFLPFVISSASRTGLQIDSLSERVRAMLEQVEPRPFTRAITTYLDYVEPGGDSDLPAHRVNVLVMPLHKENGDFIGAFALGYMGVRPGLVSLLARGDEAMYERMAKLVEPRSHEASILFCDLQGSTELTRTLPTSEYFRLIRRLWTAIDDLVARHRGIVGKHVGDGASAFFLVEDLDSASAAAASAARAAREIHDRSEDVFGETLDTSCLMRVGLHWGSSLYIGQLVPGGRLEVTALGDAVNECARIQDCAEAHQTLASKELIERLAPDDAAALGIDADKVRYRPVSQLPEATEKAIAVAGAIPVTTV